MFMSRRSLEAGILVSFALLAFAVAGFFDRNGTVDSESEEIVASSKYQHCSHLYTPDTKEEIAN